MITSLEVYGSASRSLHKQFLAKGKVDIIRKIVYWGLPFSSVRFMSMAAAGILGSGLKFSFPSLTSRHFVAVANVDMFHNPQGALSAMPSLSHQWCLSVQWILLGSAHLLLEKQAIDPLGFHGTSSKERYYRLYKAKSLQLPSSLCTDGWGR